jgi:hypothetical protein
VVYILQLNKPRLVSQKILLLDSKLMTARLVKVLTYTIFVLLFGLLFVRLVWWRPPVAALPSGSHPVASEGAWVTSWEDCSNFAYYSDTKRVFVLLCQGGLADSSRILTARSISRSKNIGPCSSFCSSGFSGVSTCWFEVILVAWTCINFKFREIKEVNLRNLSLIKRRAIKMY